MDLIAKISLTAVVVGFSVALALKFAEAILGERDIIALVGGFSVMLGFLGVGGLLIGFLMWIWQ